MIKASRAKKGMLLFLAIAFLAAFSYSVFAQGALNTILSPFERYNPAILYQNHWYIIDFFIYLMILLGLSQVVFSKQFEGRGGKAVIIGMGLSLSLASAFFEYKNNFRLVEKLGPLAILIVVVLFLWGVYKFVQALGAGGKAFAMLAFSFLFFYLCGTLPMLADWFAHNPSEYIRFIWAVLNLLAVIFLIWGIILLFSMFGGGGTPRAPWPGPEPWRRPEPGPTQRREPGEGPEQRRHEEPRQTPGQAPPTPPTPQPPRDEDFYPVIINVFRTNNGTIVEGRIEVRR